MIFESHAHYDDSKFDDDREELLSTMQENGIEKIINIGCSIESCKSTLELTKQYPFVYGAMGIHPSDIGDLNEDTFLWLREQVKKEKVVAVGEIGLDYYWDKERGRTKKSAYLVPAAVRVSKREQSAGHYPFEGCGSRYDGDHEGSTCAGNQRSYSLFFLF